MAAYFGLCSVRWESEKMGTVNREKHATVFLPFFFYSSLAGLKRARIEPIRVCYDNKLGQC